MQDGPRWGKNGVTILYVMNVMILRYILFSLMCYFPMKMPSQKLYLYANAIATLKLGTKNSSWKSSSCCNNMWLRPPRLKDIRTTPFGWDLELISISLSLGFLFRTCINELQLGSCHSMSLSASLPSVACSLDNLNLRMSLVQADSKVKTTLEAPIKADLNLPSVCS